MASGSGKFKEGDWVRCIDAKDTGIVEVGKLYRVTGCDGTYIDADGLPGGMWQRRFEPWTPAVGGRVRMVKDGLSTTGAVGKLATVERVDRMGDWPYLLNIDGPVDYKTLAVTEKYTAAKLADIEPLIAKPATPTTTYKIGDRVRVVGNEAWAGVGEVYDVTYKEVFLTMLDGRRAGDRGGFSHDEVEPVVADAPAKFKVGDRVIANGSSEAGVGVIEEVKDGGKYLVNFKDTWYARCTEKEKSISLAPSDEPDNDNTTQPDSRLSVTISADTSALDAEIDRVKRRLKKLAKRARKLGITLEFSDLQDAA